MDATATRLTYEDFLALPEPDDGSKLELWNGEVVVMPPTGARHGAIAAEIAFWLSAFVRLHRLGLVLSNDSAFAFDGSVFGPDISWLRPGRIGGGVPEGPIQGPPDLAVEVVSPSDLDSRVAAKVDRYLAGGTGRVWIVRPDNRSVTVRTIAGAISELRGEQELTSDNAGFDVPRFALKVNDIFAVLAQP